MRSFNISHPHRIFRMSKKKSKKEVFRSELEKYQAQGISLWLNGHKSSPKEIIQAYKVAEEGTYMRDYVQDDEGKISRLAFDLIQEKQP